MQSQPVTRRSDEPTPNMDGDRDDCDNLFPPTPHNAHLPAGANRRGGAYHFCNSIAKAKLCKCNNLSQKD